MLLLSLIHISFYPNKKSYPEQIQKLYLLVEELETLRDAKQIIENYKVEYQPVSYTHLDVYKRQAL